MSVILLILGILLTGAGIVTVGFGIPINEFNLGNTMIVSGTTLVAAGLILIGLAAAVDQLTQIAKALRPRAGARPAPQPQAVEPASPSAVRPSPFPLQTPAPGQVRAPVTAPPRGASPARPKPADRAGEGASESAPEASFSAIERLRSSLTRSDRRGGDVPDAAGAEDVSYSPGSPDRAGSGQEGDIGANPGANGAAAAGGAGAVEAKKPPLDFLFRSKSREPQPEGFDALWPKRVPRRDERADIGESAKPAAAEAPTDRPPRLSETLPASAPDEMRSPAILKSGVVDGMAYTLYADGSIEAQLPQGTVRFGSIAELRTHIENNS